MPQIIKCFTEESQWKIQGLFSTVFKDNRFKIYA